jgi:hypothetical protein
MLYVVGGVGGPHPGDVVADRDALIQCGEHPQSESLPQAGLADEHDREWGSGIHIAIGEEPGRLEVVFVQQVGFVDD